MDELWQEGDISVRGRADLRNGGDDVGSVSSIDGTGIDRLLADIPARLSGRVMGAGIVSHERQLRELVLAAEALAGIRDLPVEIVSESLRVANAALDRLLGRIDAEDYLDLIFSSFCIGK